MSDEVRDDDRCLTPMWIIEGLRKFAPGKMFDLFTEHDNPCSAEGYAFVVKDGSVIVVDDWAEDPSRYQFYFANPPYSRNGKRLAVDAVKQPTIAAAKWAVLITTDDSTKVNADMEKLATYIGLFDKRIPFDISRGGFRIKGGGGARFSNKLYTNFPFKTDGIRCFKLVRGEADVDDRRDSQTETTEKKETEEA